MVSFKFIVVAMTSAAFVAAAPLPGNTDGSNALAAREEIPAGSIIVGDEKTDVPDSRDILDLPPSKIGELIKAARLRKGLSQVELGIQVGVFKLAFRFIEEGKIPPTPEILARLESVLGPLL